MGPDPAARSIAPLTGPGTPLLLTGAREDPWLPEGTFRATEGVLRRAGLDVRSHLFEGAAHIVRPGELSLAEDLLKGHYAGA